MLRPGWAVHEIPLPERALLPLDDEQRLAREHEEVFLIGLPVVHRHRHARLENAQVHSELREVAVALELDDGGAARAVEPLRIARVQDEPAVARRKKPVLGRVEMSFRKHRCPERSASASVTVRIEAVRIAAYDGHGKRDAESPEVRTVDIWWMWRMQLPL